jgi:hypothetical protein
MALGRALPRSKSAREAVTAAACCMTGWTSTERGGSKAEIQAVNWPLLRIEEAIAAMDESGERERLLRYCKAIWTFRERALEALKKAGLGA